MVKVFRIRKIAIVDEEVPYTEENFPGMSIDQARQFIRDTNKDIAIVRVNVYDDGKSDS